ncbi:MAG TPA: nucleotidyltransferase family protein [Thermodesulfobacteriota bacterium]|nr:nucleotidyltransferase family protein [Thermodesulfobacteriota bacterium]
MGTRDSFTSRYPAGKGGQGPSGPKYHREGKVPRISAILLGAGQSKRMGVDKLSLPWSRKTILEHCFGTLLESEVEELIVVLSARNQGAKTLFQGRKAKIVINPLSKMGMSTSIRRGLQEVHRHSQGILIALGDQPFLKTRTVDALIRAFDRLEGGIIIPSFQGRRGHPVIFHRRFRGDLLKLKGDAGGRCVIESHPEDVQVIPVKSAGVVRDVDTWPAYQKWSRRKNRY